MNILSHRGLWTSEPEKNSLQSFEQSFQAGFGTETDVRDRLGELVIAHDMPDASSPTFEEFLSIYARYGKTQTLALNIKSDSMEGALEAALARHGVNRYFAFDMSTPTAYRMKKFHPNILFATRHSDIEPQPVLYEEAAWVWMDELSESWITNEAILHHVDAGKQVCIVSPEIHRRPSLAAWEAYRGLPSEASEQVFLCTDVPSKAQQFFHPGKVAS